MFLLNIPYLKESLFALLAIYSAVTIVRELITLCIYVDSGLVLLEFKQDYMLNPKKS